MSGDRLAAVFLGGSYEDADFYAAWARAARLVVAADGGARFLLAAGLRPDVVVGDFDSLPRADARRLEKSGVPLVRHPVRKDVTDGELAADEALRRGAGELVFAGALGALDHMLGHLAILRRLAEGGVPARLVAPGLAVAVAPASAEVILCARAGTRVSVVPLGVDAVVSLTGFEYDLDHGRLPASSCLGLGNAVAVVPAAVRVHAGAVALLVESGAEDFGGTAAPRGRAVTTGETGVWTKAAAAWALVVCAAGVLPTQGVVHSVSGGRDGLLTSVGHFAAYVILAFLLALSLGGAGNGGAGNGGADGGGGSGGPRPGDHRADGRREGGSRAARRPLARAWLLAVSLGVVIEVVQGPLPYRDAQVWDVVVNGAGAALGVAVFSATVRARARG